MTKMKVKREEVDQTGARPRHEMGAFDVVHFAAPMAQTFLRSSCREQGPATPVLLGQAVQFPALGNAHGPK